MRRAVTRRAHGGESLTGAFIRPALREARPSRSRTLPRPTGFCAPRSPVRGCWRASSRARRSTSSWGSASISVIGARGTCAYAAGCTYLDALRPLLGAALGVADGGSRWAWAAVAVTLGMARREVRADRRARRGGHTSRWDLLADARALARTLAPACRSMSCLRTKSMPSWAA